MRNLLILNFIIITLSCCNNSKLEHALLHSKDNRVELEKVLEHYANDSLKLSAAKFLIENMPGHYSFAGNGINEYYKEVFPILGMDTLSTHKKYLAEIVSEKYPGLYQNLVEDIHIISADYLIHNIDKSFELWGKSWAAHLTFDDFCEYILPYKCVELQQLDYWKDTLSTKFDSAVSKRLPNSELKSVYSTVKILGKEMHKNTDIHNEDGTSYPLLDASLIHLTPFGGCTTIAFLGAAVMRSHGIPAMIEYVPQWGWRSDRHEWFTLFSHNGAYLQMPWWFNDNPGDAFFTNSTVPKVFRRTYKPDDEVVKYLNTTKYKHPNIEPFRKDVTDLYISTNNLSIPVNTKGVQDKYVYLALFNKYQEWKVIDFGILKGKNANFSKVGRDVTYMVLGYNGKELIPISDPVFVKPNGELEYIKPDQGNKQKIKLTRKFPAMEHVAEYEYKVVGSKIECANKADFSDAEVLYEIENTSYPSLINVKASKAYRYWRLISAEDKQCNIAELHFYEAGKDTVATGKPISTKETYIESMSADKAFDNDWLTVFGSKKVNGWVGLDFGKPVNIDRVRCVARTDDNHIHYGDSYELKYWDGKYWKTIETQIAKERYLEFDAVPQNALFWLKCSRGDEETLFVYEDGVQKWR